MNVSEQSEMPLVTVIIPTYNYAHFLCDAIDSVLAQTYKNIELIVADDGSSDGTAEVVKKYGNSLRYIYQENRGLSAARNTGIKAANGKYIAFLDADDIWMPDKTTEQIRLFEGQDNVGAVTCHFYLVNETLGFLKEVKRNKNYLPEELKKKLLFGNAVGGGGSNVIARRECFDVVGLFDENLRASEDWDMWLRISQKFVIKVLEKPLLSIRISNQSMSSATNAQKMLDNELIVLNKHFGNSLTLLKRKSLSRRYQVAAIAFREAGNLEETRKCILKSMSYYPLLDKSTVSLLVYALGIKS